MLSVEHARAYLHWICVFWKIQIFKHWPRDVKNNNSEILDANAEVGLETSSFIWEF